MTDEERAQIERERRFYERRINDLEARVRQLSPPQANRARPSPSPAIVKEAGEVERRHKAALQDIAEAEAIPNDAVAFVWCRDVARAALSASNAE